MFGSGNNEHRITRPLYDVGKWHTGSTLTGAAVNALAHHLIRKGAGYAMSEAERRGKKAFKDQFGKKPKTKPKAPKKPKAKRHEKLKEQKTENTNKGKGHNTSALGTCNTHPTSRVPRWKLKRKRQYKYNVWQTVLLSKSSRIANSNNLFM